MISYQNGKRPTVFLLKFIAGIAGEKKHHPNLNKQGDKNNIMSPIVVKISIII